MHRFQSVAYIGQRAADDHAHRVIEVARLHLINDVDALVLTRRTGESMMSVSSLTRIISRLLAGIFYLQGPRATVRGRPVNACLQPLLTFFPHFPRDAALDAAGRIQSRFSSGRLAPPAVANPANPRQWQSECLGRREQSRRKIEENIAMVRTSKPKLGILLSRSALGIALALGLSPAAS